MPAFRRRRSSGRAAVCGALLGAVATAGEVRLVLSNPGEAAVASFPVTVGVPFAPGALKDANVALCDTTGNPVPVQTQVLTRWWARDQSVGVLLVSFMADTRQAHYTLSRPAAGPAPAPVAPVRVETAADTVTVTTGPLKAVLRRQGFSGFERLYFDADGDGAFAKTEAVLRDGGGRLFAGACTAATGTAAVEVEESGPVRAVVKVQGDLADAAGQRLCTYHVRLYFHAGSPLLRLDCTLIQDTDETFLDIPSLGLALPLNLPGQAQAVFHVGNGEAQVAVPLTAPDRVTLCQVGPEMKETVPNRDRPGLKEILERMRPFWNARETALWDRDERVKEFSYTIQRGTEVLRTGRKADGLLELEAAAAPFSLTCALRWFWEKHPAALQLRDGVLELLFWPPDTPLGPLHLHHGTAVTHRVFLALQPRGREAQGLALCRAALQPPLYVPTPAQFCSSLVWGDLLPRQDGRFTYYEGKARDLVTAHLSQRDSIGHGLLNFGDRGGDGGWNNGETAYDHAFFCQFIRTGDRVCHDLFEEAVLHFRDNDVCHASSSGWDYGLWLVPGYMPEAFARTCAADPVLRGNTFWYEGMPTERGSIYRHGFRHYGAPSGGPYPLNSTRVEARGMYYSGTCDVGGHGWILGVVDHYLLTGDRRSLEVAEAVGGYILKHHSLGVSRDNWKNVDLVALYQATGNDAYRKLATEAVDFIYAQREELTNGALKGGDYLSPFYTILAFFRALYDATGDTEVARKLVECADCFLKYMPTVPTGRGEVWTYIRDYKDSRCHGDFADLAYATRITGNRSYVDRALPSFVLYLQSAYHSTFAFEAPKFLAALDRLGVRALDEPLPTCRGAGLAYWADARDEANTLYVYQNFGYRADVRPASGRIEVTAPSRKVVATAPLRSGGFDFFRLEVPPDGERGTYTIRVTDPPASAYYDLADARGQLTPTPPARALGGQGRFGPALLLADGATLTMPVAGNLNREEGTIELWFKPQWSSPDAGETDGAYGYHVLLDSRDAGYDYGFQVFFYYDGKRGSRKSLLAIWADKDCSDSASVPVEWGEPAWHHVAFAWKHTEGRARGLLFLDGQRVGSIETDGARFPTRLHDRITLGANTPGNANTHLNGLLDAVRISARLKESVPADASPVWEPDTLFLSDMSLELWLPLDELTGTSTPERTGRTNAARAAAVTPCEGRRGAALQFSGQGSLVTVPLSDVTFPETPTWSLWAKPERLDGTQTILSSGCYGHFELVLEQGCLCLVAFVKTDKGKGFVRARSETPLVAGQWSHLAASFDGGTAAVFVNGTLAGKVDNEPGVRGWIRPPGDNGPDLRVGAGYRGPGQPEAVNPFVGAVDEVRLYSRALDAGGLRALEGVEVAP